MQGSKLRRAVTGVVVAPFVAMAGFCLTATSAHAAGMTVCARGCPFTTISAAVANASSDEVISVGAGQYAGGFIVTPLTIRGAGRHRTIITGGADNLGTVVEIRANPVTISGVTITGATWTSGSGLVGGGVITDGGAVLNLADCSVEGNQGNAAGGGGGIDSYGTTSISACGVSRNSAGTAADPGQGGGIHVGATAVVSVRNSRVTGNFAGWGGAVDIDAGGSVTLDHTVVAGNTAAHQGGGLDNNGVLSVTAARIDGNVADQGGGVMDNGTIVLVNDTVVRNVSNGGVGSAGGVYVTRGSTLTLSLTRIVRNQPDDVWRE